MAEFLQSLYRRVVTSKATSVVCNRPARRSSFVVVREEEVWCSTCC
jgi:hypothetical protein